MTGQDTGPVRDTGQRESLVSEASLSAALKLAT